MSLVVAGFPRTARQGQSPQSAPPDTSAPDDAAAEQALRDVCRSVVEDPRFAESGLVSGEGTRISYRADRVLVARLAELTGTFPVEADLLARARQICLELAGSEQVVTV